MADNFPLTPGSGRNAATDQVTYSGDSADVQLVRSVGVTGAEGSKTVIDLPLDAEGKSRVASHRDYKRIAVSTVDTGAAATRLTIATTAYIAGDQVYSLMTFADAARASGGSGIITGATLLNTPSTGDVIGPYDLVLFRDSGVTLANDNAAFSISGADAAKLVAVIPLAQAIDLGTGRIAQALNIAVPYDCVGTSLYGALICRAGHSFFNAYTDLTLVLHVERN